MVVVSELQVKLPMPGSGTKLSQNPLLKSTASHFHKGRRKPAAAVPRVVRISVTDADATDSSSDEEASLSNYSERRRVKRFVSHVNIEPHFTRTTTTVTVSSPTASCQAPDSHSDDAVLARRVPLERKRRQGNTGGRTASSADTAVSLSGGQVKNRRVRHWIATNVTGEVQAAVFNDGVSDLAFPRTEPEQANGRRAREPDPKSRIGPVEEKLPGSSSDDCSWRSFNSLFSSDFFTCDMIFPSVLDFDLFADSGLGLDQDYVCDVGSFVSDAFSSSSYDFGFFGISDTTWPADEQSLDIGEIFGSDPLVAI